MSGYGVNQEFADKFKPLEVKEAMKDRLDQEAGEDENEHPHTGSRSPSVYLLGNPLRQPAVDSHANCGRGDWAAIGGASGIGPNRTRWLVLRPPEG